MHRIQHDKVSNVHSIVTQYLHCVAQEAGVPRSVCEVVHTNNSIPRIVDECELLVGCEVSVYVEYVACVVHIKAFVEIPIIEAGKPLVTII
jgi:hypothetical protein